MWEWCPGRVLGFGSKPGLPNRWMDRIAPQGRVHLSAEKRINSSWLHMFSQSTEVSWGCLLSRFVPSLPKHQQMVLKNAQRWLRTGTPGTPNCFPSEHNQGDHHVDGQAVKALRCFGQGIAKPKLLETHHKVPGLGMLGRHLKAVVCKVPGHSVYVLMASTQKKEASVGGQCIY